jgi:hypothetical protein
MFAYIHFNEKEALALIRIKNPLTFLVLRTTNMKRHKTQVLGPNLQVVRNQPRFTVGRSSQSTQSALWLSR